MTFPCVLLTVDAQRALRAAGPGARIRAAYMPADGLVAVDRVADDDGISYGRGTLLPRDHPLAHASEHVWPELHRVAPEAHTAQVQLAWRDQMLTFDGLRQYAPGLKLADGSLVLTHAPDHGQADAPEFAGWHVTPRGVTPVHVECEPPSVGVAGLATRWPVLRLQREHIVLVGAGTIGTATALALGSYGVGTVSLIDPDRLLFHNLARLPLRPVDVGRHKVDVVADALRAAWPDTRPVPLRWDAVDQAADLRGLLATASLVVCTADGVAPRRVVSHLARRAGLDSVLACVLDDGAVGEVMRLRALDGHGCLRCRRTALREQGVLAAWDPENDLHRAYGAGFLHKPMTAVGGDLQLVGQAAAKTAVATLLENAGKAVHQLPGETLLLSLRAGDAAGDYGSDHALATAWAPAAPPRPGCFTCDSAGNAALHDAGKGAA